MARWIFILGISHMRQKNQHWILIPGPGWYEMFLRDSIWVPVGMFKSGYPPNTSGIATGYPLVLNKNLGSIQGGI